MYPARPSLDGTRHNLARLIIDGASRIGATNPTAPQVGVNRPSIERAASSGGDGLNSRRRAGRSPGVASRAATARETSRLAQLRPSLLTARRGMLDLCARR